jgi:S-adenosylmethionine decarboxylase|tara:strand:- start:367 stop:702 length:336 start_codon:yes stop_codon:yes gene_type:complete
MKHILFTLKGCPWEALNDDAYIKHCLVEASKWGKATMLNVTSHKFFPQGLTAFALLSESHISIHTWPEKGMAVCDVFTCGDHTDPMAAVQFLKAELDATDIIVNEFVRPLE